MTSHSTTGKQKIVECRLGRSIRAEITTGSDLISGIINLCDRCNVENGRFKATGRVQTATIGVYDPSQEVYVTHLEKQATEVLFCSGMIDTRNGESPVNAKIILADQQGQLTGGHLFSETIVQKVEIDLQEMAELEQGIV